MDKPKILSGEVLVAKGVTKIDASLPEVGLKDVTPNGSWLEQKQIQVALEARKSLIEVERIEKCGSLSHAEWRDDLMLAEVTQKVGGYWQYLGHNVGKTLYLQPEETLFLMEVNCLLLKHNEVTVSLQKAYSLLLHSSTTLTQYKVYASLSRLGYRVFRHTGSKVCKEDKSYSQKPSTLDEIEKAGSPTEFREVTSIAHTSDNIDSTLVSFAKDTLVNTSVITAQNNNELKPTIADSKSANSAKIDTVSEHDIVPKDNSVEEPKTNVPSSDNLPTESLDKALKENDKQVQESGNTINENIIEINEIKHSKESAVIQDDINSLTEDNESQNVMEVDESAVVKTENIEEVSSTTNENDQIFNNKNEAHCMETSTENIQAVESGIVSMKEEGEKLEDTEVIEVLAKEPHNQIESNKKSDTPTIDGTINLENLPNNNEENKITQFTSSENLRRHKDNYSVHNYSEKLEKLSKRQLKLGDSKNLHKFYEQLPDFLKEHVVTVPVPEQQFIPKNIFVNKNEYLLNLQSIKMRSERSLSSESQYYNSSEEVNGTNIRRIRSSSVTELPSPHIFSSVRFPRGQFRPYGFWRPQNSINFYQLMFFQARLQYQQRQQPFLRPPCYEFNSYNHIMSNNARKRIRGGQVSHLQGIKNLALRVKQTLAFRGNPDMGNLQSLQALIHSYNMRYKTKVRVNEEFDVINDQKIVETIELDDEEESKSKKPRLEDKYGEKFDENLCKLRQLAFRLRDLEAQHKATARNRRALSKAIKTFNRSYKADIYLDNVNYEVIDRKCITLDSSSESDCVVEEVPKARSKKLRNPFNILKRRSEREKSFNKPGTSKDDTSDPRVIEPRAADEEHKYKEHLTVTFNETWLPNDKDFGRAEVVPKRYMNSRLLFSNKEQFMYDFMKDDSQQYQNWWEAKISFLKYLEETNNAYKSEQARALESDLSNDVIKPLIDFEDNADMPSMLEKLRIIKNNNDKEIDTETSLKIDFDVFNRNVQNFRKRSPPKPHFRIICLNESSDVPSAADVIALHSKYEDNVPIVFAIVGAGSVSYLQMNPIDLPIYVPSNDIV